MNERELTTRIDPFADDPHNMSAEDVLEEPGERLIQDGRVPITPTELAGWRVVADGPKWKISNYRPYGIIERDPNESTYKFGDNEFPFIVVFQQGTPQEQKARAERIITAVNNFSRLIDEVETGRREINKLNSRVLESQQHILTIVDKIAEQELRALGAEDALREAQARIETLRETADRATVRAGEAQGEVEQFKGNCSCTDHDPQACLNGEVDEGQRYCHCECHSVKGEMNEVADMDSNSAVPAVGSDDDLVDSNKRQEEIKAIREWSDAVEADYFAYGLSLEAQGMTKQYAIKILLERITEVGAELTALRDENERLRTTLRTRSYCKSCRCGSLPVEGWHYHTNGADKTMCAEPELAKLLTTTTAETEGKP